MSICSQLNSRRHPALLRGMSQITVGQIVESVVGCEFEIPCKVMKIIWRTRSALEPPPLFEGPGFFRSEIGGEIRLELLDQTKRTPDEVMRTVALLNNGGIEFVVEAEAYNGVSWLGSWFAPAVSWHDSGQPTVQGRFHQLTATFNDSSSGRGTGVTELHYDRKLAVPMTRLVERQTVCDGNIESRASWRDRHEFDFGGAKISLYHVEDPGHTIVSAEFRDGLPPPQAEAWLDEALSFMLGWHVHHRVAIRYLDKRALLFIRKSFVQEKTGMPMPLRLPEQHGAFWAIFERYLANCEKEDCFAPPCALSYVWSEVLLASTGTLHSFVFALVVAIESLARQIGPPASAASKDSIGDLREYVDAWTGDPKIKQRALGILSQLNVVATSAILKSLQSEGVISEKQIQVWGDLRNKLAHGGILDYYNEQLSSWRDSLVEMAYRLALRQLGYRGEMLSHETRRIVDFLWEGPSGTPMAKVLPLHNRKG